MIVSRVRIVRFAAVLSAIAFAACSADAPNAVPSAGESTAGTTASAVPATRATHPDTTAAWQGDLPCADCPAIRSTLVLYPDGVFLHQNAYIGAGQEDTLLGEVGRWMMDADRISLVGSGAAPSHYAREADGSLRVLSTTGEEIESSLDYSLQPLEDPPAIEARIDLIGAFTYFADAPLLVECRSGLQLPVAMTEDYLALERAYTSSTTAGEPMLVRVRTRVEDQPAMEGPGTERSFVVASFEGPAGDVPCDVLALRDALASTEWRLAALEGDSIDPLPDNTQTPTFAWDPEGPSIHGNSGCNQFTGRGILRGALLVTEAVAGTRRFCEGAMELEGRYLDILNMGGWLSIRNGTLLLHQGPVEAARFVRS